MQPQLGGVSLLQLTVTDWKHSFDALLDLDIDLKAHFHTVRYRTLTQVKKTQKSTCREPYRAFSLCALPYGAVRHLTAPYGNAQIERIDSNAPFSYRTAPYVNASQKTAQIEHIDFNHCIFTACGILRHVAFLTEDAAAKNAEIEQCSISAFLRTVPSGAARCENAMIEINVFDLCVLRAVPSGT